MISTVIKDWKLVAQLGRGGMGEVWVAEQQIVKTRVAIKFLLAELSVEAQVKRFFNEAIAASRIKHAGIVRIFDVGHHEGRAYLVMELLEGETLAARVQRARKLAIGTLADVGRQIASVLEATHAAGITHRDLKPDNIYLVPDAELASGERVKVLDFGIAKLTNVTGATGLTATGGSMGTPAYMAPEQWRDAARADARADVYALGCVLFELACGRPPFVVTSIGEACTKHLTETPVRASSLTPAVAPELDGLIARMLAKEPEKRPTVKEVAAVLVALAATSAPSGALATTLGASASMVASREAPARSRTRLGLALGLGAAAAAAVVIAVVANRRDEPAPPAAPLPPKPSAGSAPSASPPAPNAAPEPPAPARANPCDPPARTDNRWIAISPPSPPIALGIDDPSAPSAHLGFRPARKVVSPSRCYAIQQHEVTWAELDAFVSRTHAQAPESPEWAKDPGARARLPASNVPWELARDYCASLGGALPSEEEWELAARGAERRPNPWGDKPLDPNSTRAYAGEPRAVMTSTQDETPEHVFDLAGNVQEWTGDIYRDDADAANDAFSTRNRAAVYAIRGLPLASTPKPERLPEDAAVHRDGLCGTGPCATDAAVIAQRLRVGFRCVIRPR